jgi:hypothetical protein
MHKRRLDEKVSDFRRSFSARFCTIPHVVKRCVPGAVLSASHNKTVTIGGRFDGTACCGAAENQPVTFTGVGLPSSSIAT